MKKNIALALFAPLYLTSPFASTVSNRENTKQKMRYILVQDPTHSMHRFHPNMIDYWIITGEVKATHSIHLSPHELKKQVEKIASYVEQQTEKTKNKPIQKKNNPLSGLEKVKEQIKEIRSKIKCFVEELKNYINSK